ARHGQGGWRFSLDYPTWQAVITHADDRRLRKRFYDAWSTRASDQGGFEQWDNSGNIERILALRHEIARLVGFSNYAEYSLATKMAGNPDDVIRFLDELAERTRASAEIELAAVQELPSEPLEAWDVNYWLEQLKQQEFSIACEVLRQYFSVDKVTAGLFELAEKLYGVRLSQLEGVAVWHDTVDYF